MSYLRSEKGSTLLLVVITIAILTVLGTTILTMSFMNTNMKFTDQRMKETLYYSESGIEQVYAIVGKYVDLALKDASTQTDAAINTKRAEMEAILNRIETDTNALLGDVNAQLELYNDYHYGDISSLSLGEFMSSGLYLKMLLFNNIFAGDQTYKDYMDKFLKLETIDLSGDVVEVNIQTGDNTAGNHGEHKLLIDTDAIATYSQEMMNDNFKAYFNDSYNKDALKHDIENLYVYLDEADTDNGAVISFESIFDYNDTGTNEFVIKGLTSTFNYKGRTRRTIETDIVIREPGDIVPLDLAQTKVQVENNPLWQYAIITQGNLQFKNNIPLVASNSVIDGSIYSLGTRPKGDADLDKSNPDSPRNYMSYKGIILDGNDTSVDVTGDVISESYVQIAAASDNCSLDINKSHVYANGVVVQFGSTDGSITVSDGNVYTRDDLELNGVRSTIDIDGSYYGFVGSAREFNETSSVVVNSSFEDSRLRITGNPTTFMSYPEPAGKEGIYIAGVSYINDTFDPNPNKPDVPSPQLSGLYQTGESIGIKGNYRAYIFPSADPSSEFYSDNLYGRTVGDESGLALVYRKVEDPDAETPVAGEYITKEEKAEYFIEIASNVDYKEIIANGEDSLGNIKLDISTSDYKYTQGAVFGVSAGTLIPYKVEPDATLTDYLEEELARDYVYIMNTLRHRREYDYLSNFYDIKGAENVVSFIGNSETAAVIPGYSEVLRVSHSFNKNTDIKSNVFGPAGVEGKEIKIVKSNNIGLFENTLDNFIIIGTGTGYSYNDGDIISFDLDGDITTPLEDAYVINVDSDNSVLQGILLTSGKVTIIGNVDFYGSIVAVEDINVLSGNIRLTNDDLEVRKYLAKLVMTNTKLSDALTQDGSLGIDLENYEYIDDVIIGSGNSDALRQNYNEFIYYQNWKIVE